MDCNTKDNGCDGGQLDYANEFIIKNGGINAEADYHNKARDGNYDQNRLVLMFLLEKDSQFDARFSCLLMFCE